MEMGAAVCGRPLRFPPFRSTCELADTKPCPSDFCFPRGIKGLTPPSGTCLVQQASWPLPKSSSEGFYPPGPSLSCARVPGPPGLGSKGGGPIGGLELANQMVGLRSRLFPLPPPPPHPAAFARGSGLHVSVFGYVRPPQGWENLAVGRSQDRERRGGAALLVRESFKFSPTGAVPRTPTC